MRKINSKTVPNRQTLPIPEEILNDMSTSKPVIFSTLDSIQSYFHVPLTERSRPYTAFTTKSGHYEWIRMTQGLSQAPLTFAKLGAKILQGVNYLYCACYLDDFICWSSSIQNHMVQLNDLFQRLRKAGLKVNPSKSSWAQPEVKFLGFKINRFGHQIDTDRLKAVESMKYPENVKELRRSLGYFNFFRRYILNYSKISRILYSLLKQNVPWTWTSNHSTAFDTLKGKLINPIMLHHQSYSEPLSLYVDASSVALGFALVQGPAHAERLVHSGGRMLNPTQSSYSISHLEVLAIVHGLQACRAFLGPSTKVTVFTDHVTCTYLNGLKTTRGQLLRLVLKLDEFNYEIIFIPGRFNVLSDYLCRRSYKLSKTKNFK